MSLRAGALLLLTGAAGCVICPLRAEAQQLPTTGLNVDLGAAVRLRPVHLGSDTYTTDFVPVIDGQWGKDLHFSVDDGVQYTAIRSGRFEFGPDLEYRQPYNDKLAPRTPKTSDTFEAGGFAKVNLTYAELETRIRKATSGYGGLSGDITLDTLVPVAPKWSLGLEARFGWADRKFARNQFGRPPKPGQPAVSTSIGDYYSAGVQAGLIYQFQPKMRFIVSASVDQVLRPSRANTTTDTRTAATLLVAVTRRFSW